MKIFNPFKSKPKEESAINEFISKNDRLLVIGGAGLITALTAATLPGILVGGAAVEIGIALQKRKNKSIEKQSINKNKENE